VLALAVGTLALGVGGVLAGSAGAVGVGLDLSAGHVISPTTIKRTPGL
jgi:hypothetical protein